MSGPDFSSIYETRISVVGDVKEQEDGTLLVKVESYEVLKDEAAPENELQEEGGNASS
ncbi:hypothetical protein [Desulfovibrio inopinatus]|uniref:hypothetical protein n=1 Tax=Desulfovibrio inopinatus TaxID=102109 RepID=UPI000416CBA3|nr:hypothetical protein [Desulfovibrio inopinatus]